MIDIEHSIDVDRPNETPTVTMRSKRRNHTSSIPFAMILNSNSPVFLQTLTKDSYKGYLVDAHQLDVTQ